VTAAEEDAYHALCGHTLGRGDQEFIHKLVVDAYAAQHADERTKPIGLTFALVGLYLAVEKGYTGREVQRVHMRPGRRRRSWPPLVLPSERGSMTASDVLAAAPGPGRDAAIHAWCASVWEAHAGSRGQVVELLREAGIL
jgi:hypothetical protein